MAIGPKREEEDKKTVKWDKEAVGRTEKLLDELLRQEMNAGSIRKETNSDIMGHSVWDSEFYLVEAADPELKDLLWSISAEEKAAVRRRYLSAGWKNVSIDTVDCRVKFYAVY